MSASGRLLLAAVLAALLGLPGGAAAVTPAKPAAVAQAWLLEKAQNKDGGFGGDAKQASSSLFSCWAAIGLGAAGVRDQELRSYLAANANVTSTGDVERTILALRAQRLAIPVALEQRLLAAQSADGGFGGLVNITSFGVLALRAAGRPASDPRVRRAAAWVVARQHRDGSFSFAGRSGPGSVDDTAIGVQALVAAGRSKRSAAVVKAVAWLLRHQNADGGFSLAAGAASNAQSTAFAIQGLAAAGRDPDARRARRSRSALGFLASLQRPDGAVRYSRTSAQSPVWVTAQALAAFARRPLPVL